MAFQLHNALAIMDKGIYTALSGGIAKTHELEILANNLANINTPGFKRDGGTFHEYLLELRRNDSPEALQREITAATLWNGRPPGDKSFVEMDGVYTDFGQGPLTKTSRDLDLGIEGKGFFEVLTPAGVRYTRQGNLNIAPDGLLVTVEGHPVLGRGRNSENKSNLVQVATEGRLTTGNSAPLTQDIPPENRKIRLGNGPVQFAEDGSIFQNNNKVAILSLIEFNEAQWLEKVGNSFFRNTDEKNMREGTRTKVHQGFLESSNVNPVREMTKLIEVSRAYESHMQAIKTYQEIDGKSVTELGGGR